MTARSTLAALTLLLSIFADAQNIATEAQPDPVLEAIQKLKEAGSERSNEITVTVNAQGKPTSPVQAETKQTETAAVMVTRKPQTKAEETPVSAPADPAPTPPDPEENFPPPAPAKEELSIHVEKINSGKGSIDPSQIKLLSPFPAKPLGTTPAGWHLDLTNHSAPPFTREVELSPGIKITLAIPPQILVPDADGATAFTIPEPGFDHALGYQQTATVGAILTNSIRQLDDDSKQLGTVIDNLQQLLISLPKPERPVNDSSDKSRKR
jgi:hypothetical protein